VSIQKNFVIKHGLEVDTNLILADAQTNKVGIGTTVPQYQLDVAGGIGVLRLSALRNLQLGSHNFSKSNMIDSITGQNMIAGGVAMIETTSVILNSTSTFNLNSAGSFGGFVAQDISIDSVSDNVFFDSDRAGTNLTANGLGINLLSSEMTDIIMYGAFDFGLWSSPTYNFSYPELQL